MCYSLYVTQHIFIDLFCYKNSVLHFLPSFSARYVFCCMDRPLQHQTPSPFASEVAKILREGATKEKAPTHCRGFRETTPPPKGVRGVEPPTAQKGEVRP